MSIFLAAFVVVAFAVTIERVSLPSRAREVGKRAADSLRVLRDPSVDDDTKERELRQQAVRLSGLVGILVAGSTLAILIPLFCVWLLDRAGVASLPEVLSILERLDFLVGATVLGFLTFLLIRWLGRT